MESKRHQFVTITCKPVILDTFYNFFLKSNLKIFYLFIHRDRETEREAETSRGRSRLHAGSPTWDLIQGLQDHALGCRQR